MTDYRVGPENRNYIPDEEYHRWLSEMYPRLLEREMAAAGGASRFRFLVIAAARPGEDISRLVTDLRKQSFRSWQLYCFGENVREGQENDGQERPAETSKLPAGDADQRIRYINADPDAGVQQLIGAALADAGRAADDNVFLCFAEPDAGLEPELLQAASAFLAKYENNAVPDIFYTDSDIREEKDGSEHFVNPSFKPDYSPDFLRSRNYIGCMTFFSGRLVREMAEQEVCWKNEEAGPAYYDYLLKAVERTDRIGHLALPLYHQSLEAWEALQGILVFWSWMP